MVALDAEVTAEQVESVASAITMWNGLGVTSLTLESRPGSAMVPVRFKAAPAAFHGVFDPELGEVLINTELSDPAQRAVVVAHELGHGMGLPHITESTRRSVMNPGNLTESPTRADAEALAAQWNHCAASAP